MRLIDTDELKYSNGLEECPTGQYVTIADIRNAKTIDAVRVVRCKDCKHCDITEVFDAKTAKSRQELFCMRYGMDIPGDWYCADGERMSE